jgi:hypothetical protein
MDGQTTQSIAVANPETGDVTEGQVEMIIKAGLQRLTWPATLIEPAAGWTVQRAANGIELRDAHGGLWVRCAVMLEPRWVSAAVSWGQVLVLYGVRLGVRVPPNLGEAPLRSHRAAGGTTAGAPSRDRGHWVRPPADTLGRPSGPGLRSWAGTL